MLYALIDNFSLETLEKIETKETQIKWRTLYALIFLPLPLPPVTSTSHLNHSYTSMLKTKELEIFKSHLFQICELSLKSRKKGYPPGSMDPKSVGWGWFYFFFYLYFFLIFGIHIDIDEEERRLFLEQDKQRKIIADLNMQNVSFNVVEP